MLVSAYASNRGWLFLELLEHFDGFSGVEGVEVRGTFDPLPEADCFICIRTGELDRSPDLSRTVVMLHDFWPHFDEGRGLTARLPEIAAVSMVHPQQMETAKVRLFQERGLFGGALRTLVRPIGARRAFTLRESMPERFTVGWVGREMRTPDGQDQKRLHLLGHALEELRRGGVEVDCIWLKPENIGGASQVDNDHYWKPDRGSRRTPSFDQLQRFYHSIDVLVVTSLPEPGPLSVFEALRCGVPVIVMDDGPRHEIEYNSQPGPIVNADRSTLDRSLFYIGMDHCREHWFEGRAAIRASMPYLQESWVEANIRLAVKVASA